MGRREAKLPGVERKNQVKAALSWRDLIVRIAGKEVSEGEWSTWTTASVLLYVIDRRAEERRTVTTTPLE